MEKKEKPGKSNQPISVTILLYCDFLAKDASNMHHLINSLHIKNNVLLFNCYYFNCEKGKQSFFLLQFIAGFLKTFDHFIYMYIFFF